MDAAGERRLPAAREQVWAALSDRGTLGDSVPAGVRIEPHATGRWTLTIAAAAAGASYRTLAAEEPGGTDARTFVSLTRPDGDGGFGGRAEITMAEDGPFTRVFWRLIADLPDEAEATVRASVEHLLTQIGQRAAGPVPVAAQGAAGAAVALAAAAPTERTPLGAILQTLAGFPRDSTLGGAAFIIVVLFVVGIL